jgi:ferredoxin
LAVAVALLPLLLAVPRRWASWVLTGACGAGALWWWNWAREASLAGSPQDALPLVVIGLAVGAAGVTTWRAPLRARFQPGGETAAASVVSFVIVLGTLALLQVRLRSPVPLLAERLVPGGGWVEGLGLACYAAWLVEKMILARQTAALRTRAWLAFSVVFFLQLALGLSGLSEFLMTGALHFPIPALIVAGPLYRESGLFMPVLFLVTVVLVGPAWCSHLCYFGAWDNVAARAVKRPAPPRRWREPMRVGVLLVVVLGAVGLRVAGVPVTYALVGASTVGIVGVGLVALWSRRTGTMEHCTAYCPMGLFANYLGKVNPFRVRIGAGCDGCGACARVCRFAALDDERIRARAPGITCTLCGDCVGSCHAREIHYTFPGLAPSTARSAFIVTAVSLHALFMGLARL